MDIHTSDLEKFGYLTVPVAPQLNLVDEINRLKKEKNAIILAHFYQTADIQDIADYLGDSLGLSQRAAETDADVIVFAGVHFMAETAKILSPEKKVLLPDLKAGCSLAESCPTESFAEFVKKYPDHTVISYVNTTAEIKALTDITCTSSNARQIVDSLPADEKIIFAPDKNLGNYVSSETGREMVIWNGACHVHQEFSVEKLVELKKQHPDAKVLAHPECNRPVLLLADFVGSTSGMLRFSQTDDNAKYIVATESGILHQMRKLSAQKTFIAAPPEDATCACSDCNFMKLNTMEKIYKCLKYEMPEITLDAEIQRKAYRPIKRMLDISAQLGL